MNPQLLADQVRRSLRAAVKDPADVLHCLTPSVRRDDGSLSWGVIVRVDGPEAHEVAIPLDDQVHGQPWATEYGQRLAARLHEIAAPLTAWAAERDRGRHVEVLVAGHSIPAPTRQVDRRPGCPNGHGPMAGAAQLSEGPTDLGTWHTCVEQGCGASYIAPSSEFAGALVRRARAQAAGDVPAPAQLGRRHGHLASVQA